ncbi:MAG: SCO family protein [Rhizobiales bacterium]|nr:SCO family protein [Hyphomicrobiales bacterium]
MQLTASRRDLTLIFAGLLVLVTILGIVAYRLLPAGQSTGTGQALIGGPFTLTDNHGQKVTEATYAGRYLMVYFGYTYCPDICPLGLQNMMAAYDALPADMREQVVPIFITVDPERDTVEAMADYVGLFSPDLVGLTGSQQETDAAAKAYRVYHAKVKDEATSADYLVDHSAFFYLMGPDGSYVSHFSHSATPEEMTAGIEDALD